MFLTEYKNSLDFDVKLNKFNLDVGWIKLSKFIDFNNIVDDFKISNSDPRELILLFNDILGLEDKNDMFNFEKSNFKCSLKTIVSYFVYDQKKSDIDVDTMVQRGKKTIIEILEQKN